MFDFWSLSEEEQHAVDVLTPKSDSWFLTLQKQERRAFGSGDWTFNTALIKNERLTGGTEDILDDIYQALSNEQPEEGSSMNLTISTFEQGDSQAELTWLREDEATFGNIYLHEESGKEAWLCPVLQVLFGKVPKKLYATFDLFA